MRDLDGKHVITGDFIAVSGDVISNLPIEGALAAHRARRQSDKNAIMTMVLREAGRSHRTKSSTVSPVFVVDPTKERCLHYEEIDNREHGERERGDHSSRLNIETEIILSHPELDVRQDLIDCNIDICTPDVLSLWSDSFDYQAPRTQFLYGVLKDYELNGKTIHTHIIKDQYAARVRNLKAYDAISKDIISRWAYPLCPDTNLLPGHSYELRKGNLYQEHGVTLARSCEVGRRTVIGRGTSIGDKTTVKNTVLGRNCRIGRNVSLDGAYLWDDVVIGDGTKVFHAIVADGVGVGNDCTVEPGSLLSYGVTIANGVTVTEGKRITAAQREDGDISDPAVVGQGGVGYEFVHDEDEDESDNESDASSGLGKYAGIISHISNKRSVQYGAALAIHRVHLHPIIRSFGRRLLPFRELWHLTVRRRRRPFRPGCRNQRLRRPTGSSIRRRRTARTSQHENDSQRLRPPSTPGRGISIHETSPRTYGKRQGGRRSRSGGILEIPRHSRTMHIRSKHRTKTRPGRSTTSDPAGTCAAQSRRYRPPLYG